MKAIFIGSKLSTLTFLSFDIRTTVGPLEVYLQNLKSLRSLRSLPAFEAEGFGAFEISRFSERCPKEYVLDVCKVCENQKRQQNVSIACYFYLNATKTLSGLKFFEF